MCKEQWLNTLYNDPMSPAFIAKEVEAQKLRETCLGVHSSSVGGWSTTPTSPSPESLLLITAHGSS